MSGSRYDARVVGTRGFLVVSREIVTARNPCYAFAVSAYSYFVQNFLLPTLVALAAAAVLAIFGGAKKWSWRKCSAIALPIVLVAFVASWSVTRSSHPEHPPVVGGTIVDESSSDPIGQAVVSLADESIRYLSEDNGNFRFDLTGKVKETERVRIHVAKNGYAPADRTVEVPAVGIVIQLHHL